MSVTKRVRNSNGKRKVFYHAEVYVRGVRLADRIFDAQAAAYNWHDEEKQKLLRGDSTSQEENEMLFSDCIEKYLEYAKLKLRFSTIQIYEGRLPFLKESPLYKMRVLDIRDRAVTQWLDWLIHHPTAKNKARKSFEKELTVLTVILNWYRNYQNADYVVPVTKKHTEKSKYKRVEARRPDYFARPEEIRSWISWLRRHRKPVYSELAVFLILTGCRVGEACGLLWDAVDLDRKMVRISRTVYWDHHHRRPVLQEATKTKDSNRVVILPDQLVEMLRLKKQTAENNIVFPGRDGSYLRYTAIQSAFNAGFKALNLPWRSTHICRHTYATMALLATRDLSSVQASLGHGSRTITEKYAKAVALLSSGTAEKTAAVFAIESENHVLGYKMPINSQ